MIKLYINNAEADVVRDRFPAGESLIRIEPNLDLGEIAHTATVTFEFCDNGDLIDLMLVMDALRRLYPMNTLPVLLIMNYLPYARQDRVCNVGESLSVKVIADLINSLNFTRVYCMNIHSDVGVALLNNLVHIDMNMLGMTLTHIFPNRDNIVLVSPDAGANKKTFSFAKQYGYPNVVRADKIRNALTGKITETKVYSEHIGDKDFLILDDICDGGYTFIALARELRELTNGKIYLHVTHGLFTKGADVFSGLIDEIFVSNLMGQPHPLIKEI